MLKKYKFDYEAWIWLCVLSLLAWIANTCLVPYGKAIFPYVSVVLIILFASFCFVLTRKNIRKEVSPCRIALLATFLFAFLVSLYFGYLYSNHDLGTYYADEISIYDGHLGMIYWFAHHWSFPKMNPVTNSNSILVHPPLYHMLAGFFMRVNAKLGIKEKVALENLQLVNLFFSQCYVLICGELLRFLGADHKRAALGMFFCGCMPIIPLMAAVPNNDILCLALMTLCIYSTVRWIHQTKLSTLLLIGASLGLAMATKLNAALLILPIAIVFLFVFFKNPHLRKSLLKHYALFLSVSVPEAIAWPLFHFFQYGVPLSYVRPVEIVSYAGYNLWSRFGFPDSDCFSTPFFEFCGKSSVNVWLTTLKTLAFDEQSRYVNQALKIFCWFFLAVLAAVLLYLFIRLIMNVIKKPSLFLCFLLLIIIVGMISYIRFNCLYPYCCSSNFRYIMYMLPVLSCGMLNVNKGEHAGPVCNPMVSA